MPTIARLLLAATLSVLVAVSAFAETISPNEAPYYVGTSVTVEGVVSQVSVSRNGTTFINFGGRYPNHVFYGVIFKSDAGQFSGVRSLQGKAVALTGNVDLYKGKPQIILRRSSQIRLRQ